MSLSDASSELSPSLAELTAPTVVVTTAATTDQPAPDRADRPVFPVRILGPTNSPNQAPTNRHDEDDVDTPHQQSNVTLRSSDANTNSHQQTRPNSNAQRDDDDGGVDPRRRIDLPPLCLLRSRGRDSYDNRTQRGYPLEGDDAGDYPPTPNQQSGREDGGEDNRYDNRQRSANNQRHDDFRQYHDDDRNYNDYQRSNNDNRQYDNDNRRNYDDSNPSGTTVIRVLHTGRSSVTTTVAITMDVDTTMIAAMTTINIRATIVVTTTIIIKMTRVMTTTTMDVEITTTNSMTITDVNTTIVETTIIVVTTTIHVRVTGVTITTIVNKAITPTGIIAKTYSGVTAIIP